jgi:uncharacterized protein YcaQ
MKIQISPAQARRFLLKKQLLSPPQSLRGSHAVETVFNTLRLIQYDPLNPCGRNPDLVLQARIADYHPDDYNDWLYEKKKGIDCYDRELCIIPIEDFPFVSYRHLQTHSHNRIGPFVKTYQKKLEELMIRIDKTGPITSSDITDVTRVDSGWGSSALFGRMALEALWRIGRLVIVKRWKSRKYYDLPHKHYKVPLPDNLRYRTIQTEHVLRRLQTVGMLSKSGTSGGWQQLGSSKDVTIIINGLLKKHQLVEVNVEGSRRTYVMNETDTALLDASSKIPTPKKMVFIAPLDNLIWDRQMLLDFFHFDYRWEVYTPLSKRKYGYYVLPILYGDQFIGRIEPVLNKSGTLEIKGFWKEPGVTWDSKTYHELNAALERFRLYVRAQKIQKISSVIHPTSKIDIKG